jgi:hypothetical protein
MTAVLLRETFMDDQLLAVALKQISALPLQWRECKSEWKIPVLNDPIEHAIIHPRYY